MLISNNKKNLVLNSKIELNETDGKGKGHYFVSRFIEAGLAHYENLGDILITKETLDKFVQSMVGCPVIINHKDIDDKNVDKERVGVISRVWYEEHDGWYYCEGIITDEQAVDLIKNQGWNVSCSYNFVSTKPKDKYHGKDYDMEFVDGEFLHLAIVETPRYEGANIVINSADWNEADHPRKESNPGTGQFINKEEKEEKRDNRSLLPYTRSILKAAKMFGQEDEKDDGYKISFTVPSQVFHERIKVLKKIIEKDKKIASMDYESAPDNRQKIIIKYKQSEEKANNNIGDITMTVLNDLKDFIMNVVNNEKEKDVEEKDVKNEKVDKRDIIRQIMAIAGENEDNEDVRTIAKLAEKLAYNPSEDSKADNSENEEKEEEFEKEKEIANKEEDKEDDKVTENEEEDKKEAKNKCKNEDKEDEKVENSIQTTKEILFGGIAKEQKEYLTREERIELGNEY